MMFAFGFVVGGLVCGALGVALGLMGWPFWAWKD